MREMLRDLRELLRYEMAVTGALLPLDSPAEPSNPPMASSSSASDSDTSTRLSLDQPYQRISELIPIDHPAASIDQLDELRAFVEEHELIELDTTRTNAVFGVGSPSADLMVIGEAPGANEDKQGEPFVGRAGKLLDKILAAIDFDRQDIYITNILKSRPPRNRDPRADEVEKHLPILYRQISLIKPKIMLCVGKVAGTTMLGRRTSLSSLRQKVHDFYGLPLMVTYHPAALLRNSNWKRPTWEDVKMLREKYDELTAPEPAES